MGKGALTAVQWDPHSTPAPGLGRDGEWENCKGTCTWFPCSMYCHSAGREEILPLGNTEGLSVSVGLNEIPGPLQC